MPQADIERRKWLDSDYAQSFLDAEKVHTDPALRRMSGPQVLQIGSLLDDRELHDLDFPELIYVHNGKAPGLKLGGGSPKTTTIVADAAFLPFEPDSFSSVILPHVLEGHSLPHQVLREAYRVLRPEGHLLLTGFNPISLVGLQRYLYPQAVIKGPYYTVKRVRDWMQLLGFEVVGSAIYQYAPLCKNSKLRNAIKFLNLAGDRWLPMFGGGYMLRARKRVFGMHLIGRAVTAGTERSRTKLATSVSAKWPQANQGHPSKLSQIE